MTDTLSEYQAAQQYKISPTLLRWFCSYSVKKDGRKLSFTENDGLYYFDKKELADFDAYLRLPWPKSDGDQRPGIPAGINHEVKFEANAACAACRTTLGELAHIEPVATTLNNHPHNLIFLCPNHHTAYDFGHKFANIEMAEVVRLKESLLIIQGIYWALQSKTVNAYFLLINKLDTLFALKKEDLVGLDNADFEKLLELALKKLRKVGTSGAKLAVKTVVGTVKVADDAPVRQQVKAFMDIQPQVSAALQADPDLKPCPLCATKGYTHQYETCPVCDGEGYVDKDLVVDLHQYEVLDCQLCKGKGHTKDFETCPPCGGEGKLTREQVELIDFSQFEFVECLLCQGRGSTAHFLTCPPCNGGGYIPARDVNNVDWTKYELEECPLCKGRGSTPDLDPCPVCGGEGELSKGWLANTDLSEWQMAKCPVCKGHGYTDFYPDCPVCVGEGKLARHYLDNINVSDYQPVDCPLCDGHGYTKKDDSCKPCNGEGKLTPHLIRKQ